MKTVKIGDAVKFYDEQSQEFNALVTAVHGVSRESNGIEWHPAINIVFITDDSAKRDVYGNQTERRSSVVYSAQQQAHGFYWTHLD